MQGPQGFATGELHVTFSCLHQQAITVLKLAEEEAAAALKRWRRNP